MAKKTNLVKMIEHQLEVIESDAAKNVLNAIADFQGSETVEGKIASLEAAITSQTSVVNATYSYAFDAVANGGPTPLYVFTKDVRNAIRAELKALLPSKASKAQELRAKFDALGQ